MDDPVPDAQQTVAGHGYRPSVRRIVDEAGRGLSRRRWYCKCGQCRWFLDDARWGRIFNEKFADYGGIVVTHNSTLAEEV